MKVEELRQTPFQLAKIQDISKDVNGPGTRAVVWWSGCTIGCKGCTNVELWPKEYGIKTTVGFVFDKLKENKSITGVTFSGGEPFQQPEALFALSKLIQFIGLDIFVFSGYYKNDLPKPEVLEHIDFLVDGPYIESEKNLSLRWRGSNNQKLWVRDVFAMEKKYPTEFLNGNLVEKTTGLEFTITEDGTTHMTGFGYTARELKKVLQKKPSL